MLSLINTKKLNYRIGQRDKVSREVIHMYKVDYLLGKVYIKYLYSSSNKSYFSITLEKIAKSLTNVTKSTR